MPPPRLQGPRCLHTKIPTSSSTNSIRTLTTTTLNRLPQLGPESPKFIRVPQPPQPDAIHRPHIKGVLPIPRQIFPRNSPDKVSPDYLSATTPDPSPQTLSAPKPPDTTTRRSVEWKARLAEHRRRNLRESLQELKTRKEKIDRRYAARSASKRREREMLLSAPTPADEKYTAPSILQSSLPTRTVLPDPDREARIAQKKANYSTSLAYKQAERRNALHTLYMNARDFIVTEEKLTEAVEKAFDPDNTQFDTDARKGLNVWNLGYPETVKEKMERSNKGEGGKAIERYAGYGGVTDERMKRIGEELTGGKM
ncbi:MAG: hypothetical protein Q9219_001842 [cf. Caloplaca sp. 3 TL-2023]